MNKKENYRHSFQWYSDRVNDWVMTITLSVVLVFLSIALFAGCVHFYCAPSTDTSEYGFFMCLALGLASGCNGIKMFYWWLNNKPCATIRKLVSDHRQAQSDLKSTSLWHELEEKSEEEIVRLKLQIGGASGVTTLPNVWRGYAIARLREIGREIAIFEFKGHDELALDVKVKEFIPAFSCAKVFGVFEDEDGPQSEVGYEDFIPHQSEIRDHLDVTEQTGDS